MHPRDDGRLVIFQLRVVGQLFGEVPQKPGRARYADHEQNSPGCEQKAEKSQDELHEQMVLLSRQTAFEESVAAGTNPAATAGSPPLPQFAADPPGRLVLCEN